MKKTTIIALSGLLILSLVGTALAWPGMGRSMFVGDEDMQAALEAGDYNGYVLAMKARNENFVDNEVTQERFEAITERYQQRLARQEQREANRAVLEEAMDQGYDAWIQAVNTLENKPWVADQVTEENFDQFVELHNAREQVRTISEELGLEAPSRMHGMKQGYMGAGQGQFKNNPRLGQGSCMSQ